MNGLAEYSGNHPAGWAHPHPARLLGQPAGAAELHRCHTGFGAASGIATSSCNTCHSNAGSPGLAERVHLLPWHHGKDRQRPRDGPLPGLLPPGGPAGADPHHRRHGGRPPEAREPAGHHDSVAAPFACTNCHASPAPDRRGPRGRPAGRPCPFGGIAITGNVRPAFNPTTLSCSATYCHGNFTAGATTAAPLWTGGAVTCTSCHGMPTTSTGEHSLHMRRGHQLLRLPRRHRHRLGHPRRTRPSTGPPCT